MRPRSGERPVCKSQFDDGFAHPWRSYNRRVLTRRSALLLVLVAILIAPAAAHAQPQGPTYIVQEGDTLFGIARVFGTTIQALVEANDIDDPANIQPGQELVIPGYEGISGRLVFESVALGESLHSLSLRTGIPRADLARLNRVVNPARLYAGLSLITPEQDPEAGGTPTADRTVISAGRSLLGLAVELDANPWALREFNDTGWAVPGDMLWAPGGDNPTSALPPWIAQLTVDPLPTVQGQPVSIELTTQGELPVGVQIGPWEVGLVETGDGSYFGVQGIHALTEIGTLDFNLRGTNEFTFNQPILVTSGGYGAEAILVAAETLDPAVTGPEDDRIASVVSAFTVPRYWEGAFAFPTDYYESFPSFFGTRRSYNGSSYSFYHNGLDLYGSTSTPVYAPAAGRVVFTDSLTVRGNATYIDHGWGVFSGFLHQSQILVQPGDLVEPGQLIGYVGATGRVTGPHLHWEVWVGGVPVDPLVWVQHVYP